MNDFVDTKDIEQWCGIQMTQNQKEEFYSELLSQMQHPKDDGLKRLMYLIAAVMTVFAVLFLTLLFAGYDAAAFVFGLAAALCSGIVFDRENWL